MTKVKTQLRKPQPKETFKHRLKQAKRRKLGRVVYADVEFLYLHDGVATFRVLTRDVDQLFTLRDGDTLKLCVPVIGEVTKL